MGALKFGRFALAGLIGTTGIGLAACGGETDAATFCDNAIAVTNQLVSVQSGSGPASRDDWERLATATEKLADEAPGELEDALAAEVAWLKEQAATGSATSSEAADAGSQIGDYIDANCADTDAYKDLQTGQPSYDTCSSDESESDDTCSSDESESNDSNSDSGFAYDSTSDSGCDSSDPLQDCGEVDAYLECEAQADDADDCRPPGYDSYDSDRETDPYDPGFDDSEKDADDSDEIEPNENEESFP